MNVTKTFLIVLGLLSSLCFIGCGDEDSNGDFEEDVTGRLQISPSNISFPQVPIGESRSQTLQLRNTSREESLTIYEIRLESRSGGSIEDIELAGIPETPLELEAVSSTDDGIDSRSLEVSFSPSDTKQDIGRIVIQSSDNRNNGRFTIPIDTLANRPLLKAEPANVRFARINPGERESRNVVVRNVGSAPLQIYEEPVLTPEGTAFSVQPPGDRRYPLTLKVFDASKAQENPDDYEYRMTVDYVPTGDQLESGEIQIVSNDLSDEVSSSESDRGISTVGVEAVANARCILVDQTTKRFGEVPVGGTQTQVVTVQNCGSETLTVRGIRLEGNTEDQEFAVEPAQFDQNGDGEADDSTELEVGETRRFIVTYSPEQVETDTANVVIESNDPVQSELTIELIGHGAEGQCPEAEAVVSSQAEGGVGRPTITAAPLDYVTLDGRDSSDPDGQVVTYNWEVIDKPDDVTVDITDSSQTGETHSVQQFRPLVAGTYEIGLTVVDNDGFESCNRAEVTVNAIPNETVHAELTWTNPEDPDETDDVGSDVDLHMVKMGPGKWFRSPYDIYFRNPNNEQGDQGSIGIWNPESPSLDIDDTDGAGPENIQMDDPTDCSWYAVGVHYYQQQFGTAYTTLRVYINEDLVFEKRNQPLRQDGQFWDVARIHWGPRGGTVVRVNETMPAPPKGKEPAVTEGMEQTGLCTKTDLY